MLSKYPKINSKQTKRNVNSDLLRSHPTTKNRATRDSRHYLRCLVPRRLSFDENVRAKEGGKETTGETTSPAVCTFPWSLTVHHQSLAFRALFCRAKNEAPEEEAGIFVLRIDERSGSLYRHKSTIVSNLCNH